MSSLILQNLKSLSPRVLTGGNSVSLVLTLNDNVACVYCVCISFIMSTWLHVFVYRASCVVCVKGEDALAAPLVPEPEPASIAAAANAGSEKEL